MVSLSPLPHVGEMQLLPGIVLSKSRLSATAARLHSVIDAT